jgi:uncharacterized protein
MVVTGTPSFVWDENKRLFNLKKHGIDFEDAIEVFSDPQSIEYRSAGEHDEARCVLIGAAGTRVIAVIYTIRELSIRIISARLARREERERWNASTS